MPPLMHAMFVASLGYQTAQSSYDRRATGNGVFRKKNCGWQTSHADSVAKICRLSVLFRSEALKIANNKRPFVVNFSLG